MHRSALSASERQPLDVAVPFKAHARELFYALRAGDSLHRGILGRNNFNHLFALLTYYNTNFSAFGHHLFVF